MFCLGQGKRQHTVSSVRLSAVGVALGHVFENYAGHVGPFLRAARRARRLRLTAARRRLRRTWFLMRVRLRRGILNPSVRPWVPGSTARRDRRIGADDQASLVAQPVE